MKRSLGIAGTLGTALIVGYSGLSSGSSPARGTAPANPIGPAQSSARSGGDHDWPGIVDSCGVLTQAFPDHGSQPSGGYTVESLLATVPDPVKTNLGLFFDRSVESLVWGVMDSGYSIECGSFPWESPADSAQPVPKIFGNDLIYKNRGEESLKFPGAVVFRGKTNPKHLLMMFLVGETPTSGINREQFANAMKWLPGTSVRIVGPSFSGSFQSLRDLITGAKGRTFQVRNGSATSKQARTNFKTWLAGVGQANTFESFIIDDTFAADSFYRYLRDTAKDPAPFAILSEDDTVYGALNLNAAGPHDYLALRFPREIAYLRNAYRSPASSALKEETRPDESRRLPLRLEGDQPGADSIPSYSRDQTPISQEAVLLDIAGTLRRESVHYAGILATDILDTVFLCRYLREAVPNIRLVVFTSDLLLLRADENASMTGILSVTTYPLFARNQHWTARQLKGGPPRRVPFADSYSEGTYNASRSLLGGPPETLLEYESPAVPHGGQPPLWIASVGKDAWWPVALIDTPGKDDGTLHTQVQPVTPGPGEVFHPELPSGVFRFLFAVAAIGGAVNVYLLMVRRFGGKPHAPLGRAEARFQTAISLLLGGASLAVGVPLLPFWHYGRYEAAGLAALLIAAANAACAIGLAVRHLLYSRRSALAALGTIQLAMLPAALYVWMNFRASGQAGLFFAYRNLFPSSGAAPILPILGVTAALLHWSFMHLNRAKSLAITRISLPENGCFALISAFSRQAQSRLWLRSAVGWRPALCAMALWFICAWPTWALWTFDGSLWSEFVILAFAALVGALAATFLQLSALWAKFRNFLEELEKQPFREAFSRLPKEFAGPIWKAIPREHLLLISSRSRDCLAALVNLPGNRAPGAEIRPRVETLRDQIAAMEESVTNGGRPTAAKYRELQDELAGAATDLVGWLTAGEWNKGSSDSLPHAETVDSVGISDSEKARLYAEEFLAFRCLVLIRHVMRNMRNLLWFLVFGFVLLVLSMESYTFQAPRAIGFQAVVLFLLLGAALTRIFAQMDRNPILSRLTNTRPHELSGEFGVRLLTAGSLPLITVLGSQFPAIGRFLSSWMEPALKALR